MASITSSISGSTTTYTITDQAGNTATVTAPAAGSPWTMAKTTISAASGLLSDGVALLNTLLLMLGSGLRPNCIPNTQASFQG